MISRFGSFFVSLAHTKETWRSLCWIVEYFFPQIDTMYKCILYLADSESFATLALGPEFCLRNGLGRQNCIDVESMVVNLELDRVGFMKKISPSGAQTRKQAKPDCPAGPGSGRTKRPEKAVPSGASGSKR